MCAAREARGSLIPIVGLGSRKSKTKWVSSLSPMGHNVPLDPNVTSAAQLSRSPLLVGV